MKNNINDRNIDIISYSFCYYDGGRSQSHNRFYLNNFTFNCCSLPFNTVLDDLDKLIYNM